MTKTSPSDCRASKQLFLACMCAATCLLAGITVPSTLAAGTDPDQGEGLNGATMPCTSPCTGKKTCASNKLACCCYPRNNPTNRTCSCKTVDNCVSDTNNVCS